MTILGVIIGASVANLTEAVCFESPALIATEPPATNGTFRSIAASQIGDIFAVGVPGRVTVPRLVDDGARFSNANETLVVAGTESFGSAVALSGSGRWLFVGAPAENSVYVYDVLGSATPLLIINGSDVALPGSSFGHAIAVSLGGDRLLIGAPTEDAGAGRVYVYALNAPDGVPTEAVLVTEIVPSVSEFGLGTSLDISCDGKTAVVGAPLTNGSAGFVGVYNAGTGVLEAQIRPSDIVSVPAVPMLRLGETVRTSGTRAMFVTTTLRAPSTSIISLQRTSSTSAVFVERAMPLLDTSIVDFGSDFDMSATTDRLVVGARDGNAYLYKFDVTKSVYVEELRTETNGTVLPARVALSRNGRKYGVARADAATPVAELVCVTARRGNFQPQC